MRSKARQEEKWIWGDTGGQERKTASKSRVCENRGRAQFMRRASPHLYVIVGRAIVKTKYTTETNFDAFRGHRKDHKGRTSFVRLETPFPVCAISSSTIGKSASEGWCGVGLCDSISRFRSSAPSIRLDISNRSEGRSRFERCLHCQGGVAFSVASLQVTIILRWEWANGDRGAPEQACRSYGVERREGIEGVERREKINEGKFWSVVTLTGFEGVKEWLV